MYLWFNLAAINVTFVIEKVISSRDKFFFSLAHEAHKQLTDTAGNDSLGLDGDDL